MFTIESRWTEPRKGPSGGYDIRSKVETLYMPKNRSCLLVCMDKACNTKYFDCDQRPLSINGERNFVSETYEHSKEKPPVLNSYTIK